MRPSSVGSMPCGVARGAVNRTLDPDRWPMKNTLYLAESLCHAGGESVRQGFPEAKIGTMIVGLTSLGSGIQAGGRL